jgi:hypothetical protein
MGFSNLCISNIITIVKSRGMRWVGTAAAAEMRNIIKLGEKN